MTDETIRHRDNTPEFEAGYERAFGTEKKPIKRGSWVWDSAQGKLVEKGAQHTPDIDAPTLLKPINEFVSPIDGSVIDDRSKLRAHNAKHGVTNTQDYGDNNGEAYFARAAANREATLQGTSYEAKMERRHEIRTQLRRRGF